MKSFLMSSSVAFVCATSAGAATVYDLIWFGGNAGLQNTGDALTFTGAGLSVDATAHKLLNDGSIGQDYRLGQYLGGLGVTSTQNNDSHEVDGKGPNEVVKLSFSQQVTVERVYFTHVQRNDDFSFTVVDGVDAGTYYASTDIPQWWWNSSYGAYTFQNDWTGTMFGFGASGKNDDFKLKGIKVSYDDTPPGQNPPPVPLPAGGALILSAFAAIAAVRRRQRG
ncbi:MAG: VPLPA-CTERM sorting domain-containing protein [Pseudomonadota bacterium]